MRKLLITLGCATALVVCNSGLASAQMPSTAKPVYFTFSKPVALPRLTLPAGKYLFRLTDTLSSRTIVQVLSEDGKKVQGIFITVPAERPAAPEQAEIRFLETPANTPPAVGTYWYPGDRTGWEFVYPRDEALRLAKSSKRAVLTTASSANADEMRTADLARVSPEGGQLPPGPESDAPSFAGDTARGEVAPDVAQAPGPATPNPQASMSQSATPRAPRTRLPSTASNTPAIALAGLMALLASFGVSLWRRVHA